MNLDLFPVNCHTIFRIYTTLHVYILLHYLDDDRISRNMSLEIMSTRFVYY